MLYRHQEESCRRMTEVYREGSPGFFDNSIMGAGKTRTFLTFFSRLCKQSPGEHLLPFFSLLLVAPLSVLVHWDQEIHQMGLDYSVYIYQGPRRSSLKLPPAKGQAPFIVLTTVDALRADLKKGDMTVLDYPFHVLGIDEAHNFANMEQKNKRLDEIPLYKEIFDRLRRLFTVLMTGTPLKNRESDVDSLFALAKIRLPLNAKDNIQEKANWYARFSYRAPVDEIHKNLPLVEHKVVRLEYSTPSIMDEARSLMGKYQQIKAKVQPYLARSQPVPKPLQIQLNAARTHSRLFDAVHAKTVVNINSSPKAHSENTKFVHVSTFCENHPDLKKVVASEYASVLRELGSYLTAQGIVWVLFDGTCNKSKRKGALDAYLHGAVNVLLLSKKAGGKPLFLSLVKYGVRFARLWTKSFWPCNVSL